MLVIPERGAGQGSKRGTGDEGAWGFPWVYVTCYGFLEPGIPDPDYITGLWIGRIRSGFVLFCFVRAVGLGRWKEWMLDVLDGKLGWVLEMQRYMQ